MLVSDEAPTTHPLASLDGATAVPRRGRRAAVGAAAKKGGRRASGEGTVFQRPDGKWVARLPPDRRSGRRREFWGDTQAEALDRRDAHIKRAHLHGEVVDDDPALAPYLKEWLAHTAAPRVRASTLDCYRLNVDKRIVPELGRLRLSEVRPVDVRRMMESVARQTSARSANLARAVLRKALEDARRDRILIGDNAAALASPVKQSHVEAQYLDADLLRRFIASVADHRLRSVFVVAASTGMRQGEILGLRWRDVDLDGPTPSLAVRGQLQRAAGKPELVEPKTKKSTRTIPLSPNLVAMLKAHKAGQTRRRLELGKLWRNPLDLVFTLDDGAPLHRSAVTHAFKAALAHAGLPVVRFHDLRHSAATLMLERNGGDLKAVSTTLGHSTITLTANTYAHAGAKVVGRTVALLDDLAT
jgi:integrase